MKLLPSSKFFNLHLFPNLALPIIIYFPLNSQAFDLYYLILLTNYVLMSHFLVRMQNL